MARWTPDALLPQKEDYNHLVKYIFTFLREKVGMIKMNNHRISHLNEPITDKWVTVIISCFKIKVVVTDIKLCRKIPRIIKLNLQQVTFAFLKALM